MTVLVHILEIVPALFSCDFSPESAQRRTLDAACVRVQRGLFVVDGDNAAESPVFRSVS